MKGYRTDKSFLSRDMQAPFFQSNTQIVHSSFRSPAISGFALRHDRERPAYRHCQVHCQGLARKPMPRHKERSKEKKSNSHHLVSSPEPCTTNEWILSHTTIGLLPGKQKEQKQVSHGRTQEMSQKPNLDKTANSSSHRSSIAMQTVDPGSSPRLPIGLAIGSVWGNNFHAAPTHVGVPVRNGWKRPIVLEGRAPLNPF